MGVSFPLTFQNCNTCKYWEGERAISDNKVSVKSATAKGSCPKSENGDKMGYMKCEHWTSL